jgi:hypothetical protein
MDDTPNFLSSRLVAENKQAKLDDDDDDGEASDR